MDSSQFEKMVLRLEQDSAAAPKMYQFKVAMLALLGFVVLAAILGTAGIGLVALFGIAALLAFSGLKVAILILKLGKLLLLLAWPLWLLVKSSVSALFVRLPAPQGIEISRSQAPALFSALDDMRKRMKGPRFHHVLVTNEMNAAMVQRPLFGLVGWPRNYLILGLPLLESLSPQEALAVVAHEYGHLAGSHSRFAGYIYRLRNTWGTIQSLAHQWQGWTSRPLQGLVGWFAPYFNAYTFVLARTNEYQADAASAELVGPRVATDALKRVHLASAHYKQFLQSLFDGVSEQKQPPSDMTTQWSQQATRVLPMEHAQEWLHDALACQPDIADTHPALKQRLLALAPDAGDYQDIPAPFSGLSAAQTWLERCLPALHEQIQREWHERVAQPWSERYAELQTQRQRLIELQALPAPSADEAIEMLRLQLQLEPKTDHRSALQGFNLLHADHALGLYLEGEYLLGKGDDAGLVMLERVMALDSSATKPCCESAFSFFNKRQDKERAQIYRDRWHARDQVEKNLRFELSNLETAHKLRVADDLEPEARKQAANIVRSLNTGVKRAYLVRRVLPSAPDHPTYVLALELTSWARLRKQHTDVVQRYAQQEWPMHVLICTVHGRYAAIRKQLSRLPSSALLLA